MDISEKLSKEIKDRVYYAALLMSVNIREAILDFNIEVTTEVPTAGASIGGQPTLYINPDFVKKHANTDEKLMMLLMHECYHVLLGHTTLFSNRSTRLDNLVFDAIINSRLCTLYEGEEYNSFFTDFYSDEKLPYCLLRPVGEKTPEKVLPVMKLLYEDNNNATYEDVYNLVKELVDENSIDLSQLLGSHVVIEGNEYDSELYQDARESILNRLKDSIRLGGKLLGSGGTLDESSTKLENVSKKAKRNFNTLLMKAGVIPSKRFSPDYNDIPRDFSSFLYEGRDRRAAGKEALSNEIFYSYNHQIPRKKRDDVLQSLVYLDVSGSMSPDIGRLLKLLINPVREGKCKTFLFSTEVAPITIKQLKEGRYKSTGGTNINCVMEHFFNHTNKKAKNMILLTDGFVRNIDKKYLDEIEKRKTKIYVGFFGYYDSYYLKKITTYSVDLH